jgi:hypothetical protein
MDEQTQESCNSCVFHGNSTYYYCSYAIATSCELHQDYHTMMMIDVFIMETNRIQEMK